MLKTFGYIVELLLMFMSVFSCMLRENTDRRPVTHLIEGTVLHYDGIFSIFRMCYDGSNLLTLSASATVPPLSLYRICGDTVRLRGEYLNYGRGPEDVLNPVIFTDTTGIYLIDNNDSPNFLARYELSEAGDLILKKKTDLSWIEHPLMFNRFVRVADDEFIVLGGRAGERELLSYIDVVKKEQKPVRFWPEDGYEREIFGKQVLYGNNASLDVCGDKVLYACPYGRYLDILTIEKTDVIAHNCIYDDLPELKTAPGSSFGLRPVSRYNGLSVTATDEYIYVIYENAMDSDRKGYPWYFVEEIEVYDWNGNFVRKYRTDCPFAMYAVSPDDRSMLTYTVDLDTGEDILVLYDLSEKL